MKAVRLTSLAGLLMFFMLCAGSTQAADSQFDLAVDSGVVFLNQNDTSLPETITNVPISLSSRFYVNRRIAVECMVSYLLSVEQQVDLGLAGVADRKTPDSVIYQASLVATFPIERSAWTPYAVAGLGAMTFLSNTDPDRLPQLEDAETMFAVNFGAGASFQISDNWFLRSEFREFAAFPSDDSDGFSLANEADPLWMERA